MRAVISITLFAILGSYGHAATVYLHDASQKYLQGSLLQEPYSVSQQAATATLAAASGLVPPYKVDSGDAKQVSNPVR